MPMTVDSPSPFLPAPYQKSPYSLAGAPAARPSRRPYGLVVLAVVVTLVIAGVGYAIGRASQTAAQPPATASARATSTSGPTSVRSTTPQVAAGTPTKGFTFAGRSITGPGYAATLPDGWAVASGNGTTNDGEAVSTLGRFYYFEGGTDPATAVCPRVADSVRAKDSDVAAPQDPTPWGTVPAVTYSLVTADKDSGAPVAYTLYCVDIPSGGSATMVAVSAVARQEATRTAAEAFLESWVWT